MHDQRWGNDWNRPQESQAGCRHYPQSVYQDDEPYGRMRGGRGDIHDGVDRGNPPDDHFRSDAGGHAPYHGDDPGSSMQPHDGGGLGWDAGAWNDAGGFDSVLSGHLFDGLGHAGAMPPIIVFAIDHLDVNFNTFIQTTQIQNTLVFLNATDGGSIDVGGDVNAIGLQSASTDQLTVIPHDPVFG
ncbi:hypothetical protein [Microvirga mediterraneensis]|uniref:Uncharacterized protein n=1 Tax=Microvirga mediterraneensis TaxID=2754695 RepID=A0A838BPF1_9HYPH|nr:hypothetical protein [Microvirga mediterraneensis]MBA1157614.1 hypothetical protein [Microvirga mediterraneensis]